MPWVHGRTAAAIIDIGESQRGLSLAEVLFPQGSTLAEPGSGEYRIAPAPGCSTLGRGDFLNAGESTTDREN
jgi:hypothetical protein